MIRTHFSELNVDETQNKAALSKNLLLRDSRNIKIFLFWIERRVKYSHLKNADYFQFNLSIAQKNILSLDIIMSISLAVYILQAFHYLDPEEKQVFITNKKHCAPVRIRLQAIVHTVVCSALKAFWGFHVGFQI